MHEGTERPHGSRIFVWICCACLAACSTGTIGEAGSEPIAGQAAGTNAVSGGSAGRGGGRTAGRGAAGGSAGAAAGGGRGTLYVGNGQLYDRCGEPVVLRGVNHPTIYVDRAGEALPEIARTGANAVRLFWFGDKGVPISAAEPAIRRATELGMIAILELHDSTCKWDLSSVSTYWTSAEAVELIERYEASLIINIANETSPPSESEFRSKYSSLVQQFRRAGIRVPLMIDGGNCGRDYGMLLSQGAALLAADPDANLIFSAHLYDRLSRADYAELFERTVEQELPFVVGEFANKEPPGCGGELDYEALISEANAHGIGWLAWSWGDDDPSTAWNSDCGEFDMASTFAYESLTSWGKDVAIEHPASIKNTAVRPASLRGTGCR